MLLSRIKADPARFQFRDKPFSLKTVEGIVAEGIDPARFDPIPVLDDGRFWIVAGDGHSRYEAISRLMTEDPPRLPIEWMDGDDWDIPTREVSLSDGIRLAYSANMGHDPFTECEEAKIFQNRLDAGESIDDIARWSHRSTGYIRKHLALNCLCLTIREAVGHVWGIDADKAIEFACACQRYSIPHQVQQQLWLKIISRGQWTQQSMKLFMQRFGEQFIKQPVSDDPGMLFELPANVGQVVEQITAAADDRRRALRGLQWLMQARSVLGEFPQLVELLEKDGMNMIAGVKQAQEEDAIALTSLVAA